jgi:hypothetical protein
LKQESRTLLELFKKNAFFSIMMLIPYTLILHVSSWFTSFPDPVTTHCWIYQQLIVQWNLSNNFEIFLSTFLILMHAVLLAHISSKYKLNNEGQLYASLFFILFCGFHHSTQSLNPSLIANLFLTFGVSELFGVYLKKNASIQLFNFGFLTGLASIFYPPYYVFILLGFIGIIILRGSRTREFLQLIGGFINVYLLAYAVLFIFNSEQSFWSQQVGGFFSPFIFSMQFSKYGWVTFGLLFMLVVINLMHYQYFKSKRSIVIQKQYDLIFWALFVSLFSTFFVRIDQIPHLMVLFTPLALLTGMLLNRIKNPLLKETLHLFIVITSLFLQFQNW